VGHYDVAFRLEANQWNGTVAPQLNVREVFEGDERYVERREWLKAEWRKPPEARDPDAVAVFADLGLAEGAARRHLLESERFRTLLDEPDLARAASSSFVGRILRRLRRLSVRSLNRGDQAAESGPRPQ